jgi:predicted flap endonuclease-1-like 5' DNA nuclease
MKLTDIVGLEEKHAKLLEKAGIRELEDLLALSYYQIAQLARAIGVAVKTLDTWQEQADLMRIEGVTPELAYLLNLIGIDSVKEFARRNAKGTLEKLDQLKKDNPKVLIKVPTLKNVENWIKIAKSLMNLPGKEEVVKKEPVPKKKEVPKKKTIPKEDTSPEIPITPNYKPFEKFEKDYGKYGAEYWNNKWEQAPIIYTARALRGASYEKQIDADVKTFIKDNDAILWHVITQVGLRKETPNETAWLIQNFVCKFLKYTHDNEAEECPEFWQFPFEAIQSEIGDCIAFYEEIYTEDGIKKVEDLNEGDRVLSYDFNSKEFCYKKITKIWEKGNLDTYRVLFRNGQSIDVSLNHPFWMRSSQKESGYEKTYLKDIDLSKWWNRKTIIARRIPYQIEDIEWLTEELCLVVGHYLAEGWKEKDGKIRSSGYELLDNIIPILEEYDIPYSEYTNRSGVPCVTMLKSEFKNFLRIIKDNSFNIHLPEELFHLPPNKLKAILNGFYLGDGHWGNYPDKRGYESNKDEVLSTSSEQLSKDIQRIGLQLGSTYHIWKQMDHKGAGKRPIYRITYNPESHFLKDYGFDNISEVSIREYKKVGITRMRDFEVEDTHTFVFKNGIIGHNCEDGAILIASLLINAGIPSWRVKVCAAQVIADPTFAPSETEEGGHAYCIYLADRPESERKLEWVILDWCYLQDPEITIEKKPLAGDGGQEGAYKDIWFTFNDQYSWAQSAFEVKEGRISHNRTVQKDEVLVPLGDVLKELAGDALLKVFQKYNIDIE